MSDNKPVALYHATSKRNVPWILSAGLFPQVGPIAKSQGVTEHRVRLYTSAERARKAIAPDGDYTALAQKAWGKGVEICLFRVYMNPGEAVAFAEVGDDFSVELACRVPAENLLLIDSDMNPVPQDQVDAIVREYGASKCAPPATYKLMSHVTPL